MVLRGLYRRSANEMTDSETCDARHQIAVALAKLVAVLIILVATVWAVLWWRNGGAWSLAVEQGVLETPHNVLTILVFALFFDAYRRGTGAV
jgi:hypothetical protein